MYKQVFSVLTALALGASSVFAVEHGEYGNYGGLEVRWQQLSRDTFTGVPVEQWDEGVHKRDDQVLDMTNFKAKRTLHPEDVGLRWIESRDALDRLEDRNFKTNCQAVLRCAKTGTTWVVATGKDAWIQYATAEAARKGYSNVMEFLNQPFVANAGGVAIAGVISGQINAATTSGCSTQNNANDTLAAVIAAAVASNPEGQALNIAVSGSTDGQWTINISAGATNTTPSTNNCG